MTNIQSYEPFKAAILTQLKQPLIVDTIRLPKSLDVGQVLIKVLCSGICGSQLGEIDGVKGHDHYLPHLLGHEACGEVLEIGQGVRTVACGDRVVMHWRQGCGIQSQAPVYSWNDRPLNAGWITTFNELAVVSENRVTTIPQDVNPETAALMGCAVTTGFGIVNNNAQLKIGESIVVLGAGGIGLSVILAARMMSAYPIIAVDLHDSKLALAQQFGATNVINTSQEDCRDTITEILGASGADVIVENTGSPEMIELAYQLTHPQGRIILAGVPRHDANVTIHTLPIHFGKRFIGSHGGDTQPDTDIPRYLNLVRAGRLSLDAMVTDRVSLDDINDGIESMRQGKIRGRCMVTMK